jgi:hypothetical protein
MEKNPKIYREKVYYNCLVEDNTSTHPLSKNQDISLDTQGRVYF